MAPQFDHDLATVSGRRISRKTVYSHLAELVTNLCCRDEILEAYVRFFCVLWALNYMFMNDNVQLHRTHIVNSFHEGADIRRMDLPSRSPDHNSIEYVWDGLGKDIFQRSRNI
ncbi:hypothetical protein TNCV_168961 [Trichonephila clavipes]|nr:hypothetical protein TNCV_168961 [Trichonephila clavipes]